MKLFWICQLLICLASTLLADKYSPELNPPNANNNSSHTTLNATLAGRIANELAKVSVSKCCLEHQSLDTSNSKHPRCVEKQGQFSPFQEILGLDLYSDNVREVKIMLTQDKHKPFTLPDCFSDFEVHKIKDAGI